MLSRGKLIVLAVLLLAVALAVLNMFFQTRASGRAVKHWGSWASRLVLSASEAEIVKLEPVSADKADDETNAAYLEVGGCRFAVRQRRDLANARGALHFRRALVTDDLYEWEPVTETPPTWRDWRYAVRFREGDAEFTLLLAKGCVAIAALADAEPLPVRPNDKGMSPLAEFVDEQFPPQDKLDRPALKDPLHPPRAVVAHILKKRMPGADDECRQHQQRATNRRKAPKRPAVRIERRHANEPA